MQGWAAFQRARSGVFIFLGFTGACAFWIFEASMHAYFAGGGVFHNLFHPDPHELWMRLVVSAMLVLLGVYGELAFAERRRFEEDLRRSRQRYRALSESAPDPIFIISRDFTIDYVNPRGAAFLGSGRDSVAGRPLEEFFPPDPLERMKGSLARVFATGESLSAEEEFRVGSSVRWLDTSLVPLFDGYGEVESVMGVSRDTTARKEAELKLRAERDRARRYLDVAGAIILIVGRDRRVKLINRRGTEILGRTEEDVVGRDWFDEFLPPGARADHEKYFSSILNGEAEDAEYHENHVVRADGEQRLIAWHNRVLTGEDGEAVGTISSGEDVTERRETERALMERLDELERFRKATVAREYRIKELRERVEELESARGLRRAEGE